MDTSCIFFVSVCRRLVCDVNFVTVPIGYSLRLSRMNFKLCSIHISACNCKAWRHYMGVGGILRRSKGL